jgi:DNA repair exonuclease SbcCD ATPase subunit
MDKYKPSWVSQLESGEGSIKLSMNGQTFYRAIITKNGSELEVCDQAINKARDYLNRDYPEITSIPYAIEVVFEYENGKKCAATISIKNQNIKMAQKIKSELDLLETQKKDLLTLQTNQITELKEETEKEKEKINQEREDLEAQKLKLQKQKEYLVYLANNNKEAITANNSFQEKIASIQNTLKNDENRVKSALFYGLKYKDLIKLLPDIEILTSFDYNSPCYKNFNNGDSNVSLVGKTHICWKQYGSSYKNEYFVVRYCDIETNACWTRDYRLGSK